MIGTLLTGKILAIGAVAAAVAIVVASAAAGVVGYNKGVAADKQRSDLVIVTMQNEARANVIAAAQEAEAKARDLLATKLKAETELLKERDANKVLRESSVASAAAADRLRRALAAAAAGGVSAGEDSVAACRERAAAFGSVLDKALQAHAICTGDIEDVAASYRAVRAAWPVIQPGAK